MPAAIRLVEFLLVGGATLVLFPLAWLFRKSVGLDSAELTVGFLTFHAASVINDPHFAVTYLLFYKDARNRAFGSVFASPTKPGAVRAPLSLFKTDLGVPKCAIGGVTLDNAPQVVAAGADLLAVISDLFDAPDVAARARAYAKLFA